MDGESRYIHTYIHTYVHEGSPPRPPPTMQPQTTELPLLARQRRKLCFGPVVPPPGRTVRARRRNSELHVDDGEAFAPELQPEGGGTAERNRSPGSSWPMVQRRASQNLVSVAVQPPAYSIARRHTVSMLRKQKACLHAAAHAAVQWRRSTMPWIVYVLCRGDGLGRIPFRCGERQQVDEGPGWAGSSQHPLSGAVCLAVRLL